MPIFEMIEKTILDILSIGEIRSHDLFDAVKIIHPDAEINEQFVVNCMMGLVSRNKIEIITLLRKKD